MCTNYTFKAGGYKRLKRLMAEAKKLKKPMSASDNCKGSRRKDTAHTGAAPVPLDMTHDLQHTAVKPLDKSRVDPEDPGAESADSSNVGALATSTDLATATSSAEAPPYVAVELVGADNASVKQAFSTVDAACTFLGCSKDALAAAFAVASQVTAGDDVWYKVTKMILFERQSTSLIPKVKGVEDDHNDVAVPRMKEARLELEAPLIPIFKSEGTVHNLS